MKITDLDLQQLLNEVSVAVAKAVYQNVPDGSPAHLYRERAKLSAEVVGRIMAVLMTDEIGHDLQERIEHCVFRTQACYLAGTADLLGPGGTLGVAS